MPKEFKTIDELIALMQDRGIITDENTRTALERESYYAIINGYKDPFLKHKGSSNNDDVYKDGVHFQWIYDLFMFDRDLRNVTFKYLVRAEAVFRSAVVYAFCSSHPGHRDYLDYSCFCEPDETLMRKHSKTSPRKHHNKNLPKLQEILANKLSSKSREFISHYMNKYGFVPLWVLSNDLTFGNLANFYQLMQRSDQMKTCTIISHVTNRDKDFGVLSPLELLKSIDLLVKFRNICAHDERLYSATYKGSNYAEMLASMLDVLTKEEVENLAREINILFGIYKDRLHGVTRIELLGNMGFIVEE